MTTIAVVGSLNCDLVSRVERLPAPGETVSATSFHTFVGGKGCNQAIAAARASLPGVTVAMVGKVGRDGFASTVRQKLAEAGVDASHVAVDPVAATGVATITVDDDGQNSIVVAPNANGLLTETDVEAARELIEGASVVLLQLEIPIATVVRAATLAKRGRALVILVPAPARATLPDELYRSVDVLVPNEVEAVTLAGRAASASDAEVAAALRARGPAAVIVTLGARGARLASSAGAELLPAPPVHAIDTTGAGDAFAGALAAELASGAGMKEAVKFAVAAGAAACTTLGAEPSLPQREAILAIANRDWG
ncbi:MAG: ribokinase [Polyangiaceae bacterium]